MARFLLICGGGALGGCLASGFLGLTAVRILLRVGASTRGGP